MMEALLKAQREKRETAAPANLASFFDSGTSSASDDNIGPPGTPPGTPPPDSPDAPASPPLMDPPALDALPPLPPPPAAPATPPEGERDVVQIQCNIESAVGLNHADGDLPYVKVLHKVGDDEWDDTGLHTRTAVNCDTGDFIYLPLHFVRILLTV